MQNVPFVFSWEEEYHEYCEVFWDSIYSKGLNGLEVWHNVYFFKFEGYSNQDRDEVFLGLCSFGLMTVIDSCWTLRKESNQSQLSFSFDI